MYAAFLCLYSYYFENRLTHVQKHWFFLKEQQEHLSRTSVIYYTSELLIKSRKIYLQIINLLYASSEINFLIYIIAKGFVLQRKIFKY